MNIIRLLVLLIMSIQGFSQRVTYTDIRRLVNRDWIMDNPMFKRTDKSFFDSQKSAMYLVAPLQISGSSIPFAWDCDLSILKFLISKDSNYISLMGVDADPNYEGIKITWTIRPSAIYWVEDKRFVTFVDNWYLFGKSDCPDTFTFPLINLHKLFDLSDAITNRISGLMIIPNDLEISKITKSELKLTTTNGRHVVGDSYDLNEDQIPDVFVYSEILVPDETKVYTRMYINIDGEWTCKWVQYSEECI